MLEKRKTSHFLDDVLSRVVLYTHMHRVLISLLLIACTNFSKFSTKTKRLEVRGKKENVSLS